MKIKKTVIKTVIKTVGINIVVLLLLVAIGFKPFVALVFLILLIVNLIYYFISKIYNTKNNSEINESLVRELSQVQVDNSIKILRTAAASLAIISFFTTAGGLYGFAFHEWWQAYFASFAIQSTLLVFSFLIWEFYVRVKSSGEQIPEFYKNIIVFIMILLYTIVLILSSSFSYVFIANNTYEEQKDKNSNISLDKFLVAQVYDLKIVNENAGKQIRNSIMKKSIELKNGLDSAQSTANQSASQGQFPQIETTSSTMDFNFINELKQDYPNIGGNIENIKNFYESTEKNLSTEIRNFETNKQSLQNKTMVALTLQADKTRIEGIISNCEININSIDSELSSLINLDDSVYVTDVNSLKNSVETLKGKYETLKTYYESLMSLSGYSNAGSGSTINGDEVLGDIHALIYTDNPDITKIEETQAKLNTVLTDNIKNGLMNESILDNLSGFSEELNEYKKYAESKQKINNLIQNEVVKSFVIENNKKLRKVGNIYYVNRENWIEERKKQYVYLIDTLKSLPNVNLVLNKNGNTNASDFDSDKILSQALTITRDLLEPITPFETAFNYLKYDFNVIAWVSLLIAIFLDMGAFLIGGFMFATKYFISNYQATNEYELKDKQRKNS